MFEHGDGEVEITIEPDTICVKGYTKYDVQNYIDSELSSALKRYVKDDVKKNEIINRARMYYSTICGSDERNIYISVRNGFYTVTATKYENDYHVEIKLTKKRK
jgi:hypothetical protein